MGETHPCSGAFPKAVYLCFCLCCVFVGGVFVFVFVFCVFGSSKATGIKVGYLVGDPCPCIVAFLLAVYLYLYLYLCCVFGSSKATGTKVGVFGGRDPSKHCCFSVGGDQ